MSVECAKKPRAAPLLTLLCVRLECQSLSLVVSLVVTKHTHARADTPSHAILMYELDCYNTFLLSANTVTNSVTKAKDLFLTSHFVYYYRIFVHGMRARCLAHFNL